MSYMSEAEGMGAYDVDYDPYEEGLSTATWTQNDGSEISVHKMSTSHIKNCIRLCQMKSSTVTFSGESTTWEEWIELFEDELSTRSSSNETKEKKSRKVPKKKKASKTIKKLLKSTTSSTLKMKCFCGKEYNARRADLKRGWALTCSKSCASIRREFGREMPTFVEEV